MNNEAVIKSIDSREGRLNLIKSFHEEKVYNWQTTFTPLNICKKIIELVEGNDTRYVVLFCLEFLEILIYDYKINPSRIIFFSDSGSHDMAKIVYDVNSILLPKNEILKNGFNKKIFSNFLKNNLFFSDEVIMKFNKLVVIGNPPYQMMNNSETLVERDGGGAGAKPIYHIFIETIIDSLSPDYFSMIVPSRWMAGGQGLDKFRNRMMNDSHLKMIRDFKGTFDVFPKDTAQIAGGVNYFLWDKSYNGLCDFNGINRSLNEYDIIVRDKESINILENVMKSSNKFVSRFISSQKPYGITGNSKPTETGTPCYFKQSIGKKFTKESISDKRGDLNFWRVLIPYILHPPEDNKPFMAFNRGRLNIAEPGSVCSESFLVVGKFDTENEAQNFISYFGTKFFRFLLRIRICSLHASRSVYNFVPDLEDYSSPWSDEQLYKKFNLSNHQIEYIESKIKEFK